MSNIKAAYKIVIPYDFSIHSQNAVATACELGQRLSAQLHLVHVVRGDWNEEQRTQALEQLASAVMPTQELQMEVIRHVCYGKPEEELIHYASKEMADLIIMGTRGRSAIMQLAIGSVAQRLLKQAPCPVVLVNGQSNSIAKSEDETDSKYVSLKRSDSPALDLIARAVSLRATDIHIDPVEDQYSVRMRIDGRIAPYCNMDQAVANHVIHQYLTLAKMDHAEPFRPREGRLQMPTNMQDIEVRITASPVAGGDAVALRLFSKQNVFLPLTGLGFSGQSLGNVQRMLHGNEGLVLVTGPTGSGKSTTVYSMLQTFASDHHNIVSIEDPVEFAVPFVRQLRVDERHGVTMTSGLRTLLRMDPDIIFIGEIRDSENAGIAFRAASSGHYVFSSLHTRDVASTITALRDLGVDDHSLAGNMVGILNQRLVRRLCAECRRAIVPGDEVGKSFENLGLPVPAQLYEASGCSKCRGTGYRGRCGVFETVVCADGLSEAITGGMAEAEIRQLIRSKGTASLAVDAFEKVREGITSYEDALAARWL